MENVLLYNEQLLLSKTESQLKTRNAALLSKSINDFTNDLHICAANDHKQNFVSSGLSAHLVLSMCSMGARNNTQKEMHDILHLSKSNSFDNFKKLMSNFDNSRLVIRIVNRIYVNKNILIKYHFLKEVRSFFDSDLVDTDFSNVDETVNVINEWYADQTDDKIKEIITKDDILPTTRLILTNAIYFKASWLNKFPSMLTVDGEFYVDKKTTIVIPTMQNNKPLFYKNLAHIDAECIGIPYRDQDFVFVVIKPKKIDGLDYVERNLDDIYLNYQDDFQNCKNIRHAKLTLPKFKVESTLQLTDDLQKLGMIDAFESTSANFKGISEKPKLDPPLYIDGVVQKAFIEVNEEGTEAAAFTRISQVGGGRPQKTIEWINFKVDRPFLYRIVNVSSNVVLFSGRVVRPTYN